MAITKGIEQLLAAARAKIEEIPAAEALALQNDDSVQIVDIRDVRELDRDGMIPGALHAPRGMLEFWVDPASPYHRDVFASGKRFVLLLRERLALGAGGGNAAGHGPGSRRPYRGRLHGLEGSGRPGRRAAPQGRIDGPPGIFPRSGMQFASCRGTVVLCGSSVAAMTKLSAKAVLAAASALLICAFSVPAFAADGISGGDTAWIMTATALVLFMTLPGLALFYAGLVRSVNVLSVMMQCFAIAGLMSILWILFGYTLAFGEGGQLIGDFSRVLAWGMGTEAASGTIPEGVFLAFQMTFAVITPALIVGAFPERMKFSSILVFSVLWLLAVYVPVCHWVWGGGWLADMGIKDFAGGLVVHATAGVSALVLASLLGPRRGFPRELRPPHNPGMTAMGAAMLWVGWFGFNGGSQLAADGGAGMAILVTHLSASTAAVVWMLIEWVKFGRPSLVGFVTGVIAGLATITPASGFVGPTGALIIGAAAGVLCFFAVGAVKNALKIDDSLDVFAVHGVGGILGTLLLAVLMSPVFDGPGYDEGVTMGDQLITQVIGVVATVVWAAVLTFITVKIVGALTGGIRTSEDEEIQGLDLVSHGESGYDLH